MTPQYEKSESEKVTHCLMDEFSKSSFIQTIHNLNKMQSACKLTPC